MDLNRLWKSVLAEIELSVSRAIFKTQFSSSRLVSFDKEVANIGVSSPLMAALIETRYYSLIKSILDHHANSNSSLIFSVLPSKKTASSKNIGPLFAEPPAEKPPDNALLMKKLHIRPEFNFETFAVSTTNQMAYAAATAVSKAPGSAYNPLFLYGGVGVGKTHLMHAIANALILQKPNLRVVYCMGEEFLNEIIEAIQTKSARLFKHKYRGAQLLMVDDVQFIAGKQTAQEEFFHTFNAVHREGAQIVLTSDRPPSEISKLEERLRSRFEGGLTVDISPPNFELRAAIVNIKAKALGLSVPSQAAQLIAANIADTRAIEGFLRRLSSESQTKNMPIDAEMVACLLRLQPGNSQGALEQKKKRRVSPAEILEAVAQHFSLKSSNLKGAKRDRPIARPRQLFMYLCRTELGLTHQDIGGILGGRDHTTIMHGVGTITHELSTNDRLRQDLEGIKQKLWV